MDDICHFESASAYQAFAREVRRANRYFRSAASEAFLEGVLQTADKRLLTLQPNTSCFRARLGNAKDSQEVKDDDCDVIEIVEWRIPYEEDGMMPFRDRASEGRANPKGIPYLYVATDEKTAVSEVRPWIGTYVSVAHLKTHRELRCVDCSDGEWLSQGLVSLTHPPRDEWDKYVWRGINAAFREPVTRTDDLADYAPTQVIAEAMRGAGYSGIVYGSSISRGGGGKNIVLFDLGSIHLRDRYIVRVDSVDVSTTRA
jgi:RES domain-containing protein